MMNETIGGLTAYVNELKDTRNHLIGQLVTTYEADELHKLSGRLYQLNQVIVILNGFIEEE